MQKIKSVISKYIICKGMDYRDLNHKIKNDYRHLRKFWNIIVTYQRTLNGNEK